MKNKEKKRKENGNFSNGGKILILILFQLKHILLLCRLLSNRLVMFDPDVFYKAKQNQKKTIEWFSREIIIKLSKNVTTIFPELNQNVIFFWFRNL